MENKSANKEKITLGDIGERIVYFAVCSLIVLGMYTVFMLCLNTFVRELFMPDENGENAFHVLGDNFWFIVYTLAFGFPLYFIYFKKNIGFKTYVLHITEDEFDWKKIFKQFTGYIGKYDIIVFAGYSLLLLLPFSDPFENPVVLISISQMFFYLLPVPRIISYIVSVLFFIAQYYTCLWFAARYWDKNRLHSSRK